VPTRDLPLLAGRTSHETISRHRLHDKGPGDDLRHTFATWLEDAAIPSRVIDELTGHTSGRHDHAASGRPMGRIYRATTPAMLARVTAALDDRIGHALAVAAYRCASAGICRWSAAERAVDLGWS
jgi:integrase